MPGGGETGVDALGSLWNMFHKNKLTIPGLKSDGDELGVTHAGTREGYYKYYAGAQAVSKRPPEGYTSWELSKGEYIVYFFEAEDFEHLVMDAVYKAHKYLFETWLPNHDLIVNPFAAERYAGHSLDTTSMEIWVLPIITK